MMKILILCTILFPIIMGLLFYKQNYKNDKSRNLFIISSTLITSLLIVGMMFFNDHQIHHIISLTDKLNIAFKVDGLSCVFLSLIALLWPLATLYAFEYMEHEKNKNRFFMFYIMTFGVVAGLASSGNLITFYFMYECLTLVTLPLVTHSYDQRSLKAGRLYFMYSIFGASMAFAGIMILYSGSSSLDFVYGGTLLQSANSNLMLIGYMLLFFGFGVKAAIFPFHGWLPRAGVAPTPVTALLHAVAVVKAGVFAIMRVTYYCFGHMFLLGTWAQYVALVFACITIVFGSSMALKHQHLKKRFAYSTISNLSYILVAVVMMSEAGLLAALLHMLFHGITKICLFFCAGAIIEKTHREYVYEIKGFGKKMPVVFMSMLVGACALSGIPLFAGFVSKYAIAIGAVSIGNHFSLIVVLCLLLSAILTAVYTFGIVVDGFIPPRDFDEKSLEGIQDPKWFMKGPLIILCILMIVLGVSSDSLISGLSMIAQGLL